LGEDEKVRAGRSFADAKQRAKSRGLRAKGFLALCSLPFALCFILSLVTLQTKKVYLRTFPDDVLPTRYSVGALRRAAQMQRFLKELQLANGAVFNDSVSFNDRVGGLELLVLNHSDWYKLSSFPYGLPLSKTKKDPATNLYNATLFIAADYQPRLLQRFDDPLLKAAKSGYKAPGEPRELLDLLAGCEWAHALYLINQKSSEEKWSDEVKVVSSFIQALKAAGHDFLLSHFEAWLHVQKAGGEEAELSDFTYPRCKMPFAKMLYLQGTLGLEALQPGSQSSLFQSTTDVQ
jgi:hypothetical protein